MTLNPSKRYDKEQIKKGASDLVSDITEALTRRKVASDIFLGTIETCRELSQQLGIALNNCKDCRVTYSNGKLEGFCEIHLHLKEVEIFQRYINAILGKN